MSTQTVVAIDPLFGDGGAAMVEVCERFGTYGMYSQEHVESWIGEGLSQRHDALTNFLRSGGRFGRSEPIDVLAARTNYFREEYAYGQTTLVDGIEPYLHHPAFVDAARAIFPGRPVIEPAIVFANLMVPGQELAVHTDVPEFRGANRKVTPQWLLVAMHHSGLFAEWRMPVATGVAWFHDCREGGEFAHYPDGADSPPQAHVVRADTALVLDTDSVFHGVDRVAQVVDEMPPLRPGMQLRYAGDEQWAVVDADREVARYRWEELRFSISWKAYCFADDAERDAWREHADDLSLDAIVERIAGDLRERDRLGPELPPNRELAELIIDTYIKFPSPETTAA